MPISIIVTKKKTHRLYGVISYSICMIIIVCYRYRWLLYTSTDTVNGPFWSPIFGLTFQVRDQVEATGLEAVQGRGQEKATVNHCEPFGFNHISFCFCFSSNFFFQKSNFGLKCCFFFWTVWLKYKFSSKEKNGNWKIRTTKTPKLLPFLQHSSTPVSILFSEFLKLLIFFVLQHSSTKTNFQLWNYWCS